jgi:ankyrin repeat protein
MSAAEGDSVSYQNLSQQRKLAKELLRAAREGDAGAIAQLRKVKADAQRFTLADAQLAIAREGGFDSWPKLVKQLEQGELEQFKRAVRQGDAATLRRLLKASPRLRRKLNEPMFDFGGRAINAAASHREALDVLIDHGADVNLRSDWDKGPFGVLDSAPEEVARHLIARGAKLTAHAAARLGWLDELRRIVDANPDVVHEKGGDGQRPLHFAKTPEIADFLLDRGADVDARCDDHDSTAAQYALAERPEVCRRLLERGATADIFMAARLDDAALAERLIAENPSCLSARVGVSGYAPVAAFGIYIWTLGNHLSPHDVAMKFGHRELFDELLRRSPAKERFLLAAMHGDEQAARAALREDPPIATSLTPQDHALLAFAASDGRADVVRLMLALGFDPKIARGMDGGTALHVASWTGGRDVVELLLRHGGSDLSARDPTHGATPLSWAAHGSVHCRRFGADHAGVIELLVAAGADLKAPGNKYGVSLLGMAAGNERVQAVLRRLEAK